MKRLLCFSLLATALLTGYMAYAQQNIQGVIDKNPGKPRVAVPDFRGSGGASQWMTTFNNTVVSDLTTSAQVNLVPKTTYPLQAPQQPSEIIVTPAPTRGTVRTQQGNRLSDWSLPPTTANFLGTGYAAEQNNQFVLFGWLFSTAENMPSVQQAQLFGKVYTGTLDEAGAVNVAHQYAADILAQFGGQSLIGTRIVFVSDRTGNKEIWSMNWDGTDQKPITNYKSISTFPNVSPDGRRVAFTSWVNGYPGIFMFSLETMRKLPFYNQRASMNAFVDFTPDGKQVIFSSTAAGGPAQLYNANVDGSNLRRLTSSGTIEVEPHINPKTGTELVWVSGRGGLPQVYRMSMEGANLQRLSNGSGEATNPSWSPDGIHIAFAWTKGFEPGNYNIFVMDVTNGQLVQLTSGEGRNENPSWSPDGAHIVYASKRGNRSQIYSMTADGKSKQALTSAGGNEKPVWTKAIK